jgi:hypothetical protein
MVDGRKREPEMLALARRAERESDYEEVDVYPRVASCLATAGLISSTPLGSSVCRALRGKCDGYCQLGFSGRRESNWWMRAVS